MTAGVERITANVEMGLQKAVAEFEMQLDSEIQYADRDSDKQTPSLHSMSVQVEAFDHDMGTLWEAFGFDKNSRARSRAQVAKPNDTEVTEAGQHV